MPPQQALVRSLPVCPEMTRMLSCDINSLPTELLQMIFRYAVSISTPEPENEFSHSRHRFTILASHVSWRWRSVALGDPFLWSYIPVATSHPDCVEYFQAFIERSHTHRLAIYIQHNHNVSPAYQQRLYVMLDSVQSHGSRLGELSMIGCEAMGDILQEKLMFAAPMLETLKLLVVSQTILPDWSYGNIFCGNVPRLRHIKLVGWSSWNPPYILFHDVRHLILSFHGVFRVPLFVLFELLGHCSRLKHLELKFVFPGPPDSLKAVIPTNLRHLRTLLLDRCDTKSILSCLTIHPMANVTVWEDPDGPYFMRMPEDCSNLHNLDDIVAVRLVVNADEMTLTAHNHNGSFFEWSQVSYLDSIDGEYDDIISSSFRQLFHSSLSQFTPFYGIREFSVDCAFEPTSFTRSIPWEAVFSPWTVLNTLTLCNYPVEEVLQALTPSIEIFCPQLETLQLQIPEANVAMFDILINFVKKRDRRGCRITTLRLKLTRDDYRTYREEIVALKDCVQNVQIQRL